MSTQIGKQYLCGRCGKMRNSQRFSETAINRYEQDIALAKRKNKPVNGVRAPVCSGCATPMIHEYECSKCGSMKSLDQFSGQQRKRGDNKECKDCVQEREDREPVFQDEVREYEIMEEMRRGTSVFGSRSTIGTMSASRRSQTERSFHDATSVVASEGTNPGFAKQGAVKLSPFEKAAIQAERLRVREDEESKQQMYHSDDEDSNTSNDEEPPY